jgi:hypothetical protein
VLALRAETWCHMIGDRRSAEAEITAVALGLTEGAFNAA